MEVLIVDDLQKAFGRNTQAVSGVSFRVNKGEVFAFLGPNGAGKTTTIKMIAGLLLPDEGAGWIDGLDPHRNPMAMERFGAVLEGNRNLYWRMTAFENMRYFGVQKGLSQRTASRRADALLERFDLISKRNHQVRSLSRGMQQKLAIAVALIHEPRMLLLDEPTLGLDVSSSMQVISLIRELREQGMAIVLTTHQLDIAETLADRVAIIRDGRIIKEASKTDLILEFTPDGYEIELGGELSPANRDVLVDEFNATFEADRICLPGDSDHLYNALNVIRPTPIRSLGRAKVDLAYIFLQLTEEGYRS
ncbi:ABC transporter ATP-binding protein [Microbulbifer halophilus]|uniref:ABC transporter ATP-binding protein n=1 Tax=Microbulbifer halophilus TaxID=453963 RepID=A0ABW5EDZ6_9GAMM|nr:ABC transporter ATP-binding protein [Microbulbifer halophilus]MCW8128223.1 ABC transporter ATP-binding protein [Microbulbifer halophilus]